MHLSVFIVAAVVLAMTPGPDTLYVMARSLGQGRGAGLISVLGICTGLLVHITTASLGLSALLMTSAWAYLILKYIGAAYLVYLGVRAFFSSSRLPLKRLNRASLKRVFYQGILSSTLNPKLALFFLAFLPQFVDPSLGHVALQTMLLGGCFALIGAVWLTGVACLTSLFGNWLQQHPQFVRSQQRLTGGMMIGLGLHLAIPEHS
jgi:threonine/homoserine/homoserine lactone efflux protein